MPTRLALLVTGASGMVLPARTLSRLAAEPRVDRIHLVVSAGAAKVMLHEGGTTGTAAESLVEAAGLDEAGLEKVAIHNDRELDAPIASGSYRLAGTAVVPCSAGTLGAFATGAANTLIRRAGAVAMKERWPFVIGFRETPMSVVHLENLRRLAWQGAVVLPPIPAFYVGGDTLERFVDAWVLRLMDHLGLFPEDRDNLRWREDWLGTAGDGSSSTDSGEEPS